MSENCRFCQYWTDETSGYTTRHNCILLRGHEGEHKFQPIAASAPAVPADRPIAWPYWQCPNDESHTLEFKSRDVTRPSGSRCKTCGVDAVYKTRPVEASGDLNGIEIVKRVLAWHQNAYAEFHSNRKHSVIEADNMAVGYAAVEVEKLLAAQPSAMERLPHEELYGMFTTIPEAVRNMYLSPAQQIKWAAQLSRSGGEK